MQDIDEAILRRMPKKFPVNLPNAAQRRSIFKLTLGDTKIDRGVNENGSPTFDLDVLVRESAGMSGSDIKEACRDAAMVPIREYMRTIKAGGQKMRGGIKGDAVRGLQTDDFFGRRGGVPQLQRALVEDDAHSHVSGSTEEVDEFDDEE
jgi:SpoVK/Ycf46/Vps4 family AAA+-type ATPase